MRRRRIGLNQPGRGSARGLLEAVLLEKVEGRTPAHGLQAREAQADTACETSARRTASSSGGGEPILGSLLAKKDARQVPTFEARLRLPYHDAKEQLFERFERAYLTENLKPSAA